MSGREIITLQFGNFSNYVGCHFFNIQNAGFSFNPDFPTDVKNDILFREGEGSNNEFTYTPRLVLVDTQNGFRKLSESGWFKKEVPTEEDVKAVSGVDDLEVVKAEPLESSEYIEEVLKSESDIADNEFVLRTVYDLDDTVQSWSDILTLPLHEKSLLSVPKQFSVGNDSNLAFQEGLSIWRDMRFRDELEDSIRFQLEESDNPQGFHTLVDACDMFSGLGTKCLEFVKDDCGKKDFVSFPFIDRLEKLEEDPAELWKKTSLEILSTAHCLVELSDISDLVCPLGAVSSLWNEIEFLREFPRLRYLSNLRYHRSALLGVCMDLVTLPYRLKSYESTMTPLVNYLYAPSRKFVSCGQLFPMPVSQIDPDFMCFLRTHEFACVSPLAAIKPEEGIQIIASRGFSKSSFPNSPAIFACSQNLRLPRTFPNIVEPSFDLSNSHLYYGKLRETAAMGTLQNTVTLKPFLDNTLTALKSINLKKLNLSSNEEFDESTALNMIENLNNISEAYAPTYYL